MKNIPLHPILRSFLALLTSVWYRIRAWIEKEKFNFALGIYQSRFDHAIIELDGRELKQRFLSVKDTWNAYSELCRMYRLPNVGFTQFIIMMQQGKLMKFTNTHHRLFIIAYTNR